MTTTNNNIQGQVVNETNHDNLALLEVVGKKQKIFAHWWFNGVLTMV